MEKNYPFPESLGGGSVTLSDLSFELYEHALKSSKVNSTDLILNFAKYTVRKVDGNAVDPFSPEFESWWNSLGKGHKAAKKRALILEAYEKNNTTTEAERKDAEENIEDIEKDGKMLYQCIIADTIVTFKDLTVNQISNIARRVNNNALLMNLYACMDSIVSVDGSSDPVAWFKGLPQKQRQLCLDMYISITSPSDEERANFFQEPQSGTSGE